MGRASTLTTEQRRTIREDVRRRRQLKMELMKVEADIEDLYDRRQELRDEIAALSPKRIGSKVGVSPTTVHYATVGRMH